MGNKNFTIIIVEDDKFLRDLLHRKLSTKGFIVEDIIDGKDALKKIKEIKPDLILLDIMLPTFSGFDILAKVRANSDKKISGIPIIMLSNLGQESNLQKAKRLGANDYIVKAHFTPDEILAKIQALLAK